MNQQSALTYSSILQSLYWKDLDNLTMAQADRDQAQALVAGVAGLEDGFDAALVAVNTNGDLSAQGRASALLAESKRSLDKLDKLTAPVLAALDAQIVGHARALRAAAAGPDASAVTELRAVKSGVAFGQIQPLLAASHYLALCEYGKDHAACVAIENAPFSPLRSPGAIEQSRAIRGVRAQPDQTRALDVAQDFRALLRPSVAAGRQQQPLNTASDNPLQVASVAAAELAEIDDEA